MRAIATLSALMLSCAGSMDGAASPVRDAGTQDSALVDDAHEASVSDSSAPMFDAGSDARVGCTTIAHVGDSLTAYTIEPLRTAYAKVSVTATIDAFGGRAILQKLPDAPKTGKQAALDLVKAGFKGCWVVALGTNDTANVAAGASYTRAKAIDEMMKAIDPEARATVMWVNTYTTKTTGYWSNANMKLWNEALAEARARWPNLEVFDWAAIAATGAAPYTDGIHHTTAGYTVRNKSIAEALVGFFPPTP